jgi:hypothetical protein
MIYLGFEEKWKPIVIKEKYETKYSISNFGKVRNDETGKILKDTMNGKYHMIFLPYTDENGEHKKFGTNICRLVAIAFIPIPKKYAKKGLGFDDLEVDHIRDGDPKNHEDDSVYNLQWITKKENIEKAKDVGLYEKVNLKGIKQPDWDWMVGEKNANAIYDAKLIHKICRAIEKNELSMREISEKYNVPYGLITDIKAGKSWTSISCMYDFSKYNKRKNQYDTHTDEERAFLDKLIESGATNAEIYRLMNLDPTKDCGWISRRRKRSGHSVSKRTVYPKEFIDKLHGLMLEGKTNKEIMKILNLESCQKTYNLLAIHRRKVNKMKGE